VGPAPWKGTHGQGGVSATVFAASASYLLEPGPRRGFRLPVPGRREMSAHDRRGVGAPGRSRQAHPRPTPPPWSLGRCRRIRSERARRHRRRLPRRRYWVHERDPTRIGGPRWHRSPSPMTRRPASPAPLPPLRIRSGTTQHDDGPARAGPAPMIPAGDPCRDGPGVTPSPRAPRPARQCRRAHPSSLTGERPRCHRRRLEPWTRCTRASRQASTRIPGDGPAQPPAPRRHPRGAGVCA